MTPTIRAVVGQVTYGTPADDVILGTAGDDVVRAGGGTDIVCGLAGDDLLDGRGGADLLRGGRGHDEIIAAPWGDRSAFDRCRGGPGIDREGGDGTCDQMVAIEIETDEHPDVFAPAPTAPDFVPEDDASEDPNP